MSLQLVGSEAFVPIRDGSLSRYTNLDCAASTPPSERVAAAVAEFLPWYSSVHRGSGAKSRHSSARYEEAHDAVLRFVGGDPAIHTVVMPRNTTEALNIAAFRMGLTKGDVVLTTMVEHHSNLLPWRRWAHVRYVDVAADGTFSVDDVVRAMDQKPAPKVLAITGASNVTGWLPPLAPIAAAARERGIVVVLDAAQLAPHRPVDMVELGIDVLALSGHKMYAPYGAGALVGPRELFSNGEPMLVGGGSATAVALDDIIWGPAPDRDEAGSPNVVGVVALDAAVRELTAHGWASTRRHERVLVDELDRQLAVIAGLRRYGPTSGVDRLPVAAFNIEGLPHALVASRLSHEFGIGVRSGCFCAHPYVTRLLDLSEQEVDDYRAKVRHGNYALLPGAVRASAGLGTTVREIKALGHALRTIVATPEVNMHYEADRNGEFTPRAESATLAPKLAAVGA